MSGVCCIRIWVMSIRLVCSHQPVCASRARSLGRHRRWITEQHPPSIPSPNLSDSQQHLLQLLATLTPEQIAALTAMRSDQRQPAEAAEKPKDTAPKGATDAGATGDTREDQEIKDIEDDMEED